MRADEVTAAGEGSILYFDLLDNRSKLTIFYKNDSTDSLSFDFLINLNNARINRYDHAYSLSTDPAFINMVLNGDTTLGTDNLFLHCMGGVKTNIWFPEILEWAGASTRVINQAKLIIPLAEEYAEGYEPSTSLILFKNLSNGGFDFVPDFLQSETYFDGTYDEGSNSYSFRISLHIQDLLKGDPDYGLGLFPNAKSIRATGMKVKGTDMMNPDRFRLEITYTEVD
jgi:hypothetical protein